VTEPKAKSTGGLRLEEIAVTASETVRPLSVGVFGGFLALLIPVLLYFLSQGQDLDKRLVEVSTKVDIIEKSVSDTQSRVERALEKDLVDIKVAIAARAAPQPSSGAP
jgi:hypothetical protein